MKSSVPRLVLNTSVLLWSFAFDFSFPAEVPAGTTAIFQFWTPDKGAMLGLSASNGLQLLVP